MKNVEARLRETVSFLTGLDHPRNYKNLKSLNKAAQFILDKFRKYGLQTAEFQEYWVSGKKYKNVIGSINTAAKKRIIIGIHYEREINNHNIQKPDQNLFAT